ncbi:TVP38/TMEM64 family protein [Thalassotalea agarivorans]|nr:VTT domain-containing protein [Thalassotalea agarivorans]
MTLISLLLFSFVLFSFLTDTQAIQQWVTEQLPEGPLGYILLLLVLTLFMAIGLPRQVCAFSWGFVAGPLLGAILSTVSATIACILTLLFSRTALSGFFKTRFNKQYHLVHGFFSKDTALKAFIIRLIPAGSNFLTNVLAGASRTPFKPYVLGTFIGFIPQMTIFAMLGAGIRVGNTTQIVASVVMIVIALLLSVYLIKKNKHAKAFKQLDIK